MSDFNYSILTETAHRPWPMPESPWLMRLVSLITLL